jgi:ABC-type multidrug transport system ATPase subunit
MTALVIRGLGKKLGGVRVLDDLELDCASGSVTVIAGPNGAGKTTLLRIVAGVLEPDRGAIEVDGVSLARRRARARARIGYVPEAADPPGHLTVNELLDLVAALKSSAPPDAALRDRLAITGLARHRIDRLSLGERRRTCLAAALIGDPALLVLDEPTNGLDTGGIDTLAELLTDRAAAGAAILLATHDADFAARIDADVLHLSAGKLSGR